MVAYGLIQSLPVNFFTEAKTFSQVSQQAPEPAPEQPRADVVSTTAVSAQWSETGATCISCGIGIISAGFSSAAEQRQHFKTDWHRYNVKRRVEKKPPLSEADFERIIEEQDEVSSISGSESSSSESDEEDEEQQHHWHRRRGGKTSTSGRGPQAVFLTKDDRPFAVWRCLLVPEHVKDLPRPEQQLATLQRVRQTPGLWALFMLKGGHFAAAVFRLKGDSTAGSSSSSSNKGHAQEPWEIVVHKTFHRYVVRAKAGGKQSSKDATGKFARSAGSRLRRYNEAALEKDIQQLLQEWAPHLASAQYIFLHAPGSNSRTLVNSKEASRAAAVAGRGQQSFLLDPLDDRLRLVPFMTNRPTFSELKRVFLLLGSVMEARLEEDVGQAAATAADSPAAKPEAQHQDQQKHAADGRNGSQESPSRDQPVASGAAAAAVIAADGLGGDAGGPSSSKSKKQDLPPLMKAAKAGDAERVARLLSAGHDPTVQDPQGSTAYRLARDKAVRDAFRRAMAQEPERWDWAAAGVPSGLTEEMEEAQQSKKADKRAKQRAKEKERKAEAEADKAASAAAKMVAIEDEIARAAAAAAALSIRGQATRNQVSGSSSSSRSPQVGGAANTAGGGSSNKPKGKKGSQAAAAAAAASRPPTAEELAQRRERMAAAAEARMKALQAAQQQQQLW